MTPFNEITTFLLSPMMTKEFTLHVYKSGKGDQKFNEDYGFNHNVVFEPTLGTIRIYTASKNTFEIVSSYIIKLYGTCDIECDESLVWEMPMARPPSETVQQKRSREVWDCVKRFALKHAS